MTWGALGYESGGRVLAPNTNKPLLTTPVWERTTILYDQLLKDTPPATITNSQLVAQMTGFEAGTEAMTVETAGWWCDVADPATSKVSHDFSTAPLPTGNIGPYPSTDLLYGYEIGIPTYAPHKTAAGEFLMFELGKSEAKAFLAAGAAIPARVSTLSNPAYWKLGAPGSDFGPFLPVLMSVAKNCMAYPSLPTMPQIEATISENLSSMAAGQESPAAAMAKANSEVTQILRSAGELH